MPIGVGCLILAMLLTPMVDGVAKVFSGAHSPMMITFLRYLAAGLVALAVAGSTGRRVVMPRNDRMGLVLRTCLLMGAMTALAAALGMVPMAKAVGGFLVAPIVSGLLGILVWRELPTATRLAGSALSCLGATALLRPAAGFDMGCLLALGGGTLLGTYLAAQRGAGEQTDALSTLTVQSLLGAGLLAPFALADGLPSATLSLFAAILTLGTLSAACHFLTVAAYQRTEATVLAPFLYFNLLTAMAVGFVWFGETLSWSSLGALAAIVTGGIVALIDPAPRTTRRRPAPPAGDHLPERPASRDSAINPCLNL